MAQFLAALCAAEVPGREETHAGQEGAESATSGRPWMLTQYFEVGATLALGATIVAPPSDTPVLVSHLLALLPPGPPPALEAGTLYTWLVDHPLALRVALRPVLALCGRTTPPLTLPVPSLVTRPASAPTLLTPAMLLALAAAAPPPCRAQWTRLFATATDGASFSAFRSALLSAGACLLVVRDTRGSVFGALTTEPWAIRATFYGREPCFLFSAWPTLRVYRPTHLNRNFQYFSSGLESCQPGLGMGGQMGYHGLWLDADFRRGHSRARPTCSTFASPQLSHDEEFTIDAVEVWDLQPREKEEAPKRPGILSQRPEDQELLEMAGRRMHSRDMQPDDRPPE